MAASKSPTSVALPVVSITTKSIVLLFAGGRSATASTWYDNIEYITIESTGNATDFGDLTETVRGKGGLSNGHGGLG